MNDRFTEKARNAIEKARAAAMELGHSYIGTEHLLLGIVRETDALGSRVLRENGFEDASILMLRSTGDPAELNRLMDLRVILTIGSWETACAINAIAAERADVVEAHLKIDTGKKRALVFGDVIVRIGGPVSVVHLDTDEGNAACTGRACVGTVIAE